MARQEQKRRLQLGLSILVIAAAACPKSASGQGFFDYVPNQPYTAHVVTTNLESSANGTLVRREAKRIEMRDSQGRTRVEFYAPSSPGCGQAGQQQSGGQVGQQLSDRPDWVNLYVPQLREFIQLFPGSKTARVMTFPGTGPIPTHGPNPYTIQTTTEDLPGQTLYGIYAVGTRTTEVILREDNNGTNIANVLETWRSPDLGIVVLFKHTSSDPRTTGESSSEIQQLDRSEPDPALFEIPAGYKIEIVSLPQADPPGSSASAEQPAKQR